MPVKPSSKIIKRKVLKFLNDRKMFTSVDIGNSIKDDGNVFIRNREVSDWLRKNFMRVAFENGYPYNTTLITVHAGTMQMVNAYLYHHYSVSSDRYLDRDQRAKSPRLAY